MKLNKESWYKILETLKEIDIDLYACFMEGKLVNYKNNTLYIMFKETKKFHYNIVNSNKDKILHISNKILDKPIYYDFFVEGDYVGKVVELFDGEVIKTDLSVLGGEYGDKI